MTLQDRMVLCSENYGKWKTLALTARSVEESRKCMERAFFWLELQTAFITLFTIERSVEDSPETNLKIITAKANLSKKLAEYAQKIIKELEMG